MYEDFSNPQGNYQELLEKFIYGQKVVRTVSFTEYTKYRFMGEGFEFENGYKWLSYGGACSNGDCNTSYIVDPDNNLLAKLDW